MAVHDLGKNSHLNNHEIIKKNQIKKLWVFFFNPARIFLCLSKSFFSLPCRKNQP
jgi:hypothetical protein